VLTLKTTGRFRSDYKRAKKRGYDMSLLESVIDTLLEEKPLDPVHRDHALQGRFAALRECHVKDDWLFVYRIDRGTLTLSASYTGTHEDIF